MVDGLDELRPKLMSRGPAILLSVVLLACSDGQAAAARNFAPPAEGQPGAVVDSILSSAAAFERFVAGLPAPLGLENGAETPRALVQRFMDALADRDTQALSSMILSRAEYGFLYYPTSEYSRKPYELAPAIAWTLSLASNAKAIGRLIERLGGSPLTLESYACAKTRNQGLNTIHSGCRVTYRGPSGSETRSLFQSIIERDGSAKFLSYSGDF